MSDTLRSSRHVYGPAALIVVSALFATTAEAGPHRARLSRDLESRIAAARGEPATVIVSGSDERVRSLATRYGAVLKKPLRGGAVLEVTAGQLEALSDDPSVDHLSGDAPVQRMAVTNEATGATQVWAGIAGLGGYTGRGVGVAVIDSGVATHAGLRGRVVAEFDFTGKKGSAVDKFGHGTHVAGIVAGNDTGDTRELHPALTSSAFGCSGRTGPATRATSSTRSTGRSSTGRSSRCASSISPSDIRSSNRTVTIRSARPCSVPSAPGWWWWRRRETSERWTMAAQSSAG